MACSLSAALLVGCLQYCGRANAFYALSVDGEMKKVGKGQFGLPKKDIGFLRNYMGPIIDRVPRDRDELRTYIKKSILDQYAAKKGLLSGEFNFKSERERLITFILLRVNGSLPIYRVLDHVPDDLVSLLTGDKGNCSDAAIRLLMVLDVFDVAGRTITLWTPALTGHVIVDAYDPAERKAYLLDPSFNIISRIDNVDEGYFDVLFSMSVKERGAYLGDPDNVRFWPFYMADFQSAKEYAAEYPDIDEWRENSYLTIRDRTLAALIYELKFVFDDWKQHFPNRMPMTLDWYSYSREKTNANSDLFYSKAIKSLKLFGPQHPLATRSLLEKASINCRDFMKAELNCSEISKLGFACDGC